VEQWNCPIVSGVRLTFPRIQGFPQLSNCQNQPTKEARDTSDGIGLADLASRTQEPDEESCRVRVSGLGHLLVPPSTMISSSHFFRRERDAPSSSRCFTAHSSHR
jgi:hypothetical protein